MERIRRFFRMPVQESHLGYALIFCLLAMSAMSIAIVWQAQIIANQRESIRWLEHLKFGG